MNHNSNKNLSLQVPLIRKSSYKPSTKREKKKLILINYKQEVENIFTGKKRTRVYFKHKTLEKRRRQSQRRHSFRFQAPKRDPKKILETRSRRMKFLMFFSETVLGNFSFFLLRSRNIVYWKWSLCGERDEEKRRNSMDHYSRRSWTRLQPKTWMFSLGLKNV